MIKYLLAVCFVALFAVPASAQCNGRFCVRSTTYNRPAVQYSAPQTRLVKVCQNGRCYYVRQTIPGSYQVNQQTVRSTTVERPILGTTVTRERVIASQPVVKKTVVAAVPTVQTATIKSDPLAALVNL